jgi:hypothetical protein
MLAGDEITNDISVVPQKYLSGTYASWAIAREIDVMVPLIVRDLTMTVGLLVKVDKEEASLEEFSIKTLNSESAKSESMLMVAKELDITSE